MQNNEPQSLEELKEEEKEKIKERAENKILEKENAEFLIKLLDRAENKAEVIKISALAMTYKRTGFHFDVRLEKNEGKTIRYLKKNEKLSFYQGGITHKLIIGDNYPALLNLSIAYKNKIKMIYIDPPYSKDALGEFAKTNYDNAITRDNLLSMLYPRLLLAKRLLKEDGVIFCSIDDKNQAYVKCLFDEVFGEGNFVATCAVVTNRGGRDYGGIAKTHEYLLCYKKTLETELQQLQDENKKFAYEDEFGAFNLMELRNRNIKFNKENRPNLYYPFYINPKNIDENGLFEISLETQDGFIELYPMQSQGVDTVWRWGKEKAKKFLNIDIKAKVKQDGNFMIVQKNRLTTKRQRSIWDEKEFVNEQGTECLKTIFNKEIFGYPKSVSLIQRIIQISTFNDTELTQEPEIILDFFAGSGTTAHAVMELNREDGGKRQCILVTNNEKTELNPNGIALDVTSKRLKRIMSGECYDGSKDFKWLEKNEPYGDSLEVSEIVSLPSSHRGVFEKIDEKLYGKDFKGNIQDKIEWVCEEFELTCKKIEGEE